MSLASSAGVAPMLAGRSLAIMGDGGFWHNGFLSGVASNQLNGGDKVLLIMKNGYTSATGTQELVSSPGEQRRSWRRSRSPVRADRTIENTLRGAGVKWLRNVYTYRVADMAKTLREAFTTDEPGLKVIIAEGECQLERQRRIRPVLARLLGSGERVVRTRFGVDDDTCSGDHSCIRLSGCPSLTLKAFVRPAEGRPGGAREPQLRRLRPVRRSRARRDPVPVVLPRRDRAEPGRLGPLHRAPARERHRLAAAGVKVSNKGAMSPCISPNPADHLLSCRRLSPFDRLIRFSQCDPGGIVYFVDFFDLCNGTVEDWFTEMIGMTFNEIHLERRWGFPIVDTGCHFYRLGPAERTSEAHAVDREARPQLDRVLDPRHGQGRGEVPRAPQGGDDLARHLPRDPDPGRPAREDGGVRRGACVSAATIRAHAQDLPRRVPDPLFALRSGGHRLFPALLRPPPHRDGRLVHLRPRGAVRRLHRQEEARRPDGEHAHGLRQPRAHRRPARHRAARRAAGRTSIEMAIDSFVEDRPCFRSRHTVCTFTHTTHKAVPIPDDLRAKMTEYLDESYQAGG